MEGPYVCDTLHLAQIFTCQGPCVSKRPFSPSCHQPQRHAATLFLPCWRGAGTWPASFWEVIETLLTSTALHSEVNLQKAAPDTSEEELHGCGRAIRRSICAALLDKSITPDELCGELRMLIDSHLSLASLSAQAHAGASERVSAPVTLS